MSDILMVEENHPLQHLVRTVTPYLTGELKAMIEKAIIMLKENVIYISNRLFVENQARCCF